MGNWNINIQGLGCHNNKDRDVPEDADKMAKEFVDKLKKAGHIVEHAIFTYGGREKLTLPDNLLP